MAWSKVLVMLLLIVVTFASYAQENRYMVFFHDKEGSPYSVSAPEAFLGERSLARRDRQGIDVTERDLPVDSTYMQGVVTAGATVLHATRWMNGVLVQCSSALVPTLEALAYVDSVVLVAPGVQSFGGGRRRPSGRKSSSHAIEEVTDNQLSKLGIDAMHEAGYHGESMIIAVLDAGFPGVNTALPFQHIFTEQRFNDSVSYNYVHHNTDVFQDDDHGTQVFSLIAAYLPGTFIGGAYKASYQLYVTEDASSEHHLEEYNWLFAAERADSAGADIINSSLGYNTFDAPSEDYTHADLDGETAIVTKAANWAAERGIIVVVSAGNEGANSWRKVTPPADAQNLLAVGSVSAQEGRSSTSSMGPTADGRVKPDVMATGQGTAVVKPNGTTGFNSGTSFSTPLVTSLVAGVWQRYPDLTSLEILETIRLSGSHASSPDTLVGYGVPNFQAVVNRLEWAPQENIFEIFPNPVSSTLYIRPEDPELINASRVEIVSLQGQVIADRQIGFSWLNGTYSADISTLSPGMYFLRIWLGQQIISFKMVKL